MENIDSKKYVVLDVETNGLSSLENDLLSISLYKPDDGKSYDSLEFAKHIDNLFTHNGTISFIIGGSNGLEDKIIDLCNEKLSFSSMTFPHGLFRGILLEQIYRSLKINNNETYHK